MKISKEKVLICLTVLLVFLIAGTYFFCQTKPKSTEKSALSELGIVTQVAHGNGILVAVGLDYPDSENPKNIFIASNDQGESWTKLSAPDNLTGTFNIKYLNGSFVAGGQIISTNTPKIIFSKDNARTWSLSSNTLKNVKALAFGNGKWIGVGFHGDLKKHYFISSDNLLDWNDHTLTISPNHSFLWSVTFDNNQFIAVGSDIVFDSMNNKLTFENGVAFTSSDGSTWVTKALPMGTPGLRAVKYINNSFFIAVGDDGTILKLDNNSSSWSKKTSGTTFTLSGIAYGNEKIIIVGGYSFEGDDVHGLVLVSKDNGDTWEEAYSDPQKLFFNVTYAFGKFFIAGKEKNENQGIILKRTFE